MANAPRKIWAEEPKRNYGETRALVLKYTKAGLGLRAIAAACGISTQAVHYHLKKLREAGELPDQEKTG